MLQHIEKYYSDKILEHGISANGVDWNSTESQELRFEQLTTVLPPKNTFSVLDFGCGYGALLTYLSSRFGTFDYVGYDLSQKMILAAKENTKPVSGVSAKFTVKQPIKKFDYVLASGVFNIRLDSDDTLWTKYLIDSIHTMDRTAKRGFSFNVLSSYSDIALQKRHLYYADPLFFFDYCKRNFSKNVALLHDYDLYEFTLVVRKKIA